MLCDSNEARLIRAFHRAEKGWRRSQARLGRGVLHYDTAITFLWKFCQFMWNISEMSQRKRVTERKRARGKERETEKKRILKKKNERGGK